MRRFILGAFFLSVAACSPKPAPVVAPTPAAARQATPAERPTPDSIRWVRESAEYRAAVTQVYRIATARVEQAATSRQAGSWAVVLDADETVLDNSTYQLERAKIGLAFTPESWNLWVKRREAVGLPGSGAFLARVRALGGKIAIVTNRLGTECDDTRAVFDSNKLAYDVILCREAGMPSDKNPRFEAVASGAALRSSTPLDVVMFVGDNILDFPRLSQDVKTQGAPALTDFGVRFFLVPNPMYGSWQ